MKLLARMSLFALTVMSICAHATVIDAEDRGWYRNNPINTQFESSFAGNLNYLVGIGVVANIQTPTQTITIRGEYRNYFAFDLSAYTGQTFGSAVLSLYNPKLGDPYNSSLTSGGFAQSHPALNAFPYETYQLHRVSSDMTSLLAGTAGEIGFNDLGDGTVFGSYDASLSDNGTYIRISLNSDGLDALNSAAGGQFVIGGNISTLDNDKSQTVFGFSNSNLLSETQLILTAATTQVPEPGTIGLILAGLTAFGFQRRRYSKPR